jgi:TonB family protein
MGGGPLLAVMALVATQGGQHRPPLALTGDTARPINGQNWINLAEDYPASAIRSLMDGTTAVRLFVNGRGRVSGCILLESAGHPTLDMATCRMLRARARFEPFAGTGLATFDYRIVWDLAQTTPILPATPTREHTTRVEPRPEPKVLVVPVPSAAD